MCATERATDAGQESRATDAGQREARRGGSMAVLIKTREQIAHLRAAGRIVAETYEALRPHVVPGVTTGELDRIAEEFIRKQGAFPTYKGYGAVPAGRGQPGRP